MLWCKTLWVKPFSGWSKARRESVRNHLWADCSATNNKTRMGFFCDFSQDIKYSSIWNEYPKLFSLWVKIKYSQDIRPPKLQSRTLYFATAFGDLRVCAFDFPVNGFQIFFPIYQLSILEWHSWLHQNVTLTLMTKSTLGLRRPFMPNEGEWKIWKSPQM